MEKTFDPAAVEGRISAAWEAAGAFRAGRADRAGAKPYCIVIPPPNVTGNLHMGHALNNTLQDILCRYWRMKGLDVLWQPGTDHAGIATQMVVERQLAERQMPDRRAMGREAFLKRVWEWKAESGGAIVNQLKRLGASCDWSRERFTMDEGLSRAVAKVFVQLHREGLIYKDKRLVNWDPKFQSAISDLEVQQIEQRGSFAWTREQGLPFEIEALNKILARNPNGHLYYFDYPLVDDNGAPSGGHLTVATTRPETMLGDSGVAVHPDDARFADLHGRFLRLPLVGRLIKIVADDYSDPEKGTGAVKITPAHDFNDFEVGRRHALPMINILDAGASLSLRDNEAFSAGVAPSADFDEVMRLDGVDRFAARARVVAMMHARGLLQKIEPHAHTVPHGDRSGVVIEPWLTDQWYVDAKTLAQPALEAVRAGRTVFTPRNWEKTYYDWLENIEPWCVSRQLWWGHQIPAWYSPWGGVHVAESEEEAWGEALAEGVEKGALSEAEAAIIAADPERLAETFPRDEDVLDTWFSSALWPFSTLGWPDETPELARYYPTSVLVTGFDIIFFWVARMMMMGLHFQNDAPFRDVYIHALVRDEKGAKMSKSKGNVMDPLDIVDGVTLEALLAKRVETIANKAEAARIAADTKREFPKGIPALGTDALRFFLAAMAAQGRDVKLSLPRIEGYRNFATKLWNAARFAEMNGCAQDASFDPLQVREPLNRWILGEANKAVAETSAAIEAYRFNDAANAAYRFVWNVFCDWHVELAKPVLLGEDSDARRETRAATAFVLRQILKLLHPFMPFLTEELWALTGTDGSLLALSSWPDLSRPEDVEAEAEIGWLIDLVSEIRSVRSEMGVPAGARLPLTMIGGGADVAARAAAWGPTMMNLARLSAIELADAAPEGSAQIIARGIVAALPLKGVIDVATERARLEKQAEKERREISRIDGQLANADFVARAPAEVIEDNRERRAASLSLVARIGAALDRLRDISTALTPR